MRQALMALWRGWKRIAQAIGHFQAQVLWTLLYLLIVAPFALGVKVFTDPLRIKKRSSSSWWLEHPRQTLTLEEAHRQF